MEIMIAALAALVINGIVWFATKHNWVLKTDTIVLIIAAILGIGYAVFQTTLPPAVQEQAVDFAAKAMSGSWIVWQFLVKRFITKEISKTL